LKKKDSGFKFSTRTVTKDGFLKRLCGKKN